MGSGNNHHNFIMLADFLVILALPQNPNFFMSYEAEIV